MPYGHDQMGNVAVAQKHIADVDSLFHDFPEPAWVLVVYAH